MKLFQQIKFITEMNSEDYENAYITARSAKLFYKEIPDQIKEFFKDAKNIDRFKEMLLTISVKGNFDYFNVNIMNKYILNEYSNELFIDLLKLNLRIGNITKEFQSSYIEFIIKFRLGVLDNSPKWDNVKKFQILVSLLSNLEQEEGMKFFKNCKMNQPIKPNILKLFDVTIEWIPYRKVVFDKKDKLIAIVKTYDDNELYQCRKKYNHKIIPIYSNHRHFKNNSIYNKGVYIT